MEDDSKVEVDYDTFVDYRKSQAEIASHNIRTLSKTIVAVSSGALGISLAFLQNIVGSPPYAAVLLLLVAWGLYVVAITACLWSSMTGWRAADAEIERQDASFTENHTFNTERNGYRDLTKRLNGAAIIAFTLATVSLFLFAALNLGDRNGATTNTSHPSSETTAAQTTTS